jgi:hypothetical protein
MNTGNNYLKSAKTEFLRYKALGEKAMDQLEPGQLFFSSNDDSNSIAIIVKHMYGNMLSRWTDFLTTDGEKPWRGRDAEFENPIEDKEVLMKQWEEGWNCLFTAIDPLQDEQLSAIVFIRNEAHTVVEAINRQLTHYSYHVGQIVFAAKQLKKGAWNSLSIAKNKSKEFNAGKIGGA